jgi:hypothetical protein
MPPVKAHTMNTRRSIHLAGRYYRGYPPDAPLGHAEDTVELSLDETVFVLVDVYGRGFDPGDDLGSAAELYKPPRGPPYAARTRGIGVGADCFPRSFVRHWRRF